MENEKMKILKMIEEGKITAQEGSQLLSALDQEEHIGTKTKTGTAKWIRIKVLSSEDGNKTKVNVNVPLALVETGIKIGKHFDKDLAASMNGIEISDIVDMIKDGAEGKIVEVVSDNGDIVEVYVE